MEENNALRRREYVKTIRQSFNMPEQPTEEALIPPEDPPALWLFFKLRIILSLILFLGFLLLFYQQYEIAGYDAATIREVVAETDHWFSQFPGQ